jgi:hypothetical protein
MEQGIKLTMLVVCNDSERHCAVSLPQFVRPAGSFNILLMFLSL